MEKYELLNLLGQGTYGKVIKGKVKETGDFVAVKKIKNWENNKMIKKITLREIRILRILNHPNIVKLIEVIYEREKSYLVFEYVESTVMRCSKNLDIDEFKKIVYQLLMALNHCHEQNVIHRDVKPDNVLLSSKGVVKLCDFGFAKVFKANQKLTEYVSTRWYRAPELLEGGGNYSYPVDVWSVGCLCAELLTGKPLFPGNNDADMLTKITKFCGNLTENLNFEFKNHAHFKSFEVCINQQRSQDIHTNPQQTNSIPQLLTY
ncbi:hypothetical protein SteCoe_12594 [Stentor coeruleus]|uniref:cyclin-dependent kinase n=1 Tax=Stentor coeruleus TaxID=5963 RepID=A0A1R2CAE1_9CILI|nr:hypothetical protein SteCoe_12594 [Stentor coeruleus]